MQIPPWKRPDNWSVNAHQRLVDGHNETHFTTPAGPTEVQNSPAGRGLIDYGRPPPAPIFRMIVTTPDVAPDVLLAKQFDGTNETGEDKPIRVFFQREEDEQIFVYRPVGGTDAIYDGQPVVWQELPALGRGEFDGMGVYTEGGQAVWAFTKAHAVPGLSL